MNDESRPSLAADEGVPPATDEGSSPVNVALSLACFGCARLPSDMDDGQEKHPVCHKCVKLKVPTTYWCCVDCPGNPGAWQLHMVYHKELKQDRKMREDGGVAHQQNREAAEWQAQHAEETGDKYSELMAKGMQYISKEDWRRAAKVYRKAISLKPEEPSAYCNLGAVLNNSLHRVEAAKWCLEATERYPVGSEGWAEATARVFEMLMQEDCSEVAKPEWWNDEGLKALSVRVVRAAPMKAGVNNMRATVLRGPINGAWDARLRSAAELREAATYYERAAALHPAPALKVKLIKIAYWCRSQAVAGSM